MKRLIILTIAFFVYSLSTNAQLKNLGPKINTIHHEIRPTVSESGGVLFFTVEGGPLNKKGQDIWMSIKSKESGWRKAERLPDYINSQKNNGAYWCSSNGSKLLLRGTYDSKNACGFSISERRDGRWTQPAPVIVEDYNILSRGIYSGATLSTDERVMIMYFSEETNSDMNDLWISFLNDSTGNYSRPVKLNISVEDDDEISPYISPDNKTLFFASDKKGGFGSYDIWMTKRLDSTWMKWSDPMNIGAPFNTKYWDAYFSIGDNGLIGYTSINVKHSLPSNLGGADITSDTLPSFLRPEYPIVIEPIHDTIEIHDTAIVNAPCSPLDTMSTENLIKELKNSRILFDFGKSDLRSDSYSKLDLAIELMKRDPNMKLELSGHTDAIGIDKRNQLQSDERANSAKQYVISRGIDPKRIKAIGMANKMPIAPNTTDYGRQLNRRVDIKFIQE